MSQSNRVMEFEAPKGMSSYYALWNMSDGLFANAGL